MDLYNNMFGYGEYDRKYKGGILITDVLHFDLG